MCVCDYFSMSAWDQLNVLLCPEWNDNTFQPPNISGYLFKLHIFGHEIYLPYVYSTNQVKI